MTDLMSAAEKVIHRRMGVKAGEALLVITDERDGVVVLESGKLLLAEAL